MPGIHSKSLKPTSSNLLPIFFSSTVTSAILIIRFYRSYSTKRKQIACTNKQLIATNSSSKNNQNHSQINSRQKFMFILKLLKPSRKEYGLLAFITSLLVTRSLADIWMIYLGTLLESAIITKNPAKFKHRLIQFGLTMPAMTLVNSLLKYSTDSLSLSLRKSLTIKILTKYLSNLTFYNVNSLDIISDIDKFSSSIISIYTQLAKPFLDILVYVYGISRNIGISVPIYMMSYLVLAAGFLINLRKPISAFTSMEQAYENGFRDSCIKIKTNAEEIAFYSGQKWELNNLLINFKQLVNHLIKFGEFKFVTSYAENIVAKYMATVVGYFAVSRPFFKITSLTSEERLETYYKSGRMLVNLAQAIGKLVINGKEVSRLTGYSTRIYELLEKLNTDKNNNSATSLGTYKIQDNVIQFEKVPIVTPNGDILLNELNLKITAGQNLIICGPNGCGKSSLFRILSELWQLRSGILTKPQAAQLFYIPQRPYLISGTLRDQIIYPQSMEEMFAFGSTDKDLEFILHLVELEWLISSNRNSNTTTSINNKNNGNIVKPISCTLNTIQNWTETLSGGEKQRLAMARLIYHKPKFAILDECTSALSLDIEGKIYSYCKSIGITLVTVSHRKSLWQFHDYYLYMDGKGKSEYGKITPESKIFGS